jgi:hypothetical protein
LHDHTGQKGGKLRQIALALSLLALIGALAVAAGSGGSAARQVVPTPEGQLGGPAPLATEPLSPALPTPTPESTATPTPTPTASAAATASPVAEDATDPEWCQVAPRSLAEVLALAETPPAAATPGGLNLESGVSADEATIAAVTATLREYVACLNAGDYLRLAALSTDAHLRILIAAVADDPAALRDLLATPQPRPRAAWVRIVSVDAIRALTDGRVAATVVLEGPTAVAARSEQRFTFVFAASGEHWLIDDVNPQPGDGEREPGLGDTDSAGPGTHRPEGSLATGLARR